MALLVFIASFSCCWSAPAAINPEGKEEALAPTAAQATIGKMYVAESHLAGWPLRIFVTTNIPEQVVPTLTIALAHSGDLGSGAGCTAIKAQNVARHQSWSGGANVDGQNTEHVGTWLLFDVRTCKLRPFQPLSRAQLIVNWAGDGRPCTACSVVSTTELSMGIPRVAMIYSIVVLLLFTGLIVLVVKLCGCSAVGFFLTDGRLSLSMVQMAIWTYTVGLVVLYDLMVRLDAASVPASLIVLMTSSLLTAGVSSTIVGGAERTGPADLSDAEKAQLEDPATPPDVVAQLKKKQEAYQAHQSASAVVVRPGVAHPPSTGRAPHEEKTIRVRLFELFTLEDEPADGSRLSLSRVQMLFWTVVIVIMFVAKSLLSPELWEVPWTLVALMGVSQVGYLAGKYGYAPAAAKSS